MPRAGKPVDGIRWIFFLAAGLAAAAGCAQIVGIEPWKPADPCDAPDVDPVTCEPSTECEDCLYSKPMACEAARMDCEADAGSVCSTINTCAGQCKADADPVGCVQACCTKSSGDAQFDTYLTCLCTSCEAECGSKTIGCDMFCDPPP